MKKILAILMAALMVLAFAACSKTPVEDEVTTEAEAQIEEIASEEIAEEVATQ